MGLLVDFLLVFMLYIVFMIAAFLLTAFFFAAFDEISEKRKNCAGHIILLLTTSLYWFIALYSLFKGA
jgi:hypothetical protein